MARYEDTLLDQNKRPLGGAKVWVYIDDLTVEGGAAASLTDDDGDALTNPVLTSPDGSFLFNAPDGFYVLKYIANGRALRTDYRVIVGTGGEIYRGPVGNDGAGVTLLPQMVDASPSDGDPVILTQVGGGEFIYRLGNYSSLVAADTQGALYVPLTSDPSGVNGACIRRVDTALNPKWFGITGSGDETTKVQALLNFAALIGGNVYFPAGSYSWTAVTVPFDVNIQCAGTGVRFIPLDNTSAFITFNGRNRLSGTFAVEPATQRTGGKIFAFSGGDVKIDHFSATKCFRVADISGAVSNVTLDELHLFANNNNGASELITVNTVGAGCAVGNVLADNDVAAQPIACIRIRACADFTIFGKCNIIHCGKDLLIDPPSGSVVASVFGGSLFLDTAVSGLTLDTSMGGSIVRIAFDKIEASSHTGNCVDVIATAGSIAGVHIGYLETHLGSSSGLNVAGSNLSGMVVGVHKAGALTNGAAVQMGASAVGLEIARAEYGNIDGTGAANKYNLTLGTGSALTFANLRSTTATLANLNGTIAGLIIARATGATLVRNKGNDSIASGGTSVTITHGLAAAPGPNDIRLTPTNNHAATPIFLDTATITATQFTVRCNSAAATLLNFAWEARCLGS